jgi:hypothetical protein
VNSFFHNILGTPAFWLGILACVIIIFLIARLRNYFPRVFRNAGKQISEVRESFTSTTDARLRNDVYHHAQKQHLASCMFSLDEIATVPKVLTPLVQSSQAMELAPTDSVSLSVPYIPDWPEFGAVYNASTMTIVESLQGGANIILAGHPGIGKTVALAWLASALSRNQRGLGILDGWLPLYVHAQDLYHFLHYKPEELSSQDGAKGERKRSPVHSEQDVVDILVKCIATYVSSLTLPRLPAIVHSAITRRRAIVLLDGMDELPPHQSGAISRFLGDLIEKCSGLRVVVALSYEDLAGLPPLGFSVLAMAAWGEYERSSFLSRWSRVWEKNVSPHERDKSKKITSAYLNSWLKIGNAMLSPFEYTLKVWAAYAGDICGTDGPAAIEAYIRRMAGTDPKVRTRLEQFALGLSLLNTPSSESHPTPTPTPEPEGEANPLNPEMPTEPSITTKPAFSRRTSLRLPPDTDTLLENGLLTKYEGSWIGFSHPILTGYLAGNALSTSGAISLLLSSPAFIGKTLALYYLALFGDVAPIINEMIQEDDIIHTNHLRIARWLQVAPKNRPWRSTILRTLTVIVQKEKECLSLAAKIIAAIAFSGDKGVSIYFRQLIKSDHSGLKQLAALGCGILGDKKSLIELNDMLQEPSPASIRAASLAMAAIADKQSLEILATNLLNGNEMVRRCAAEALANEPVEGHPALKDGSTMEDLMVRRAVAFGLIRVNLPWATKIVENMQLEDSEWVVRNAAIQAFDELKRKGSYAPKQISDLTEAQWLADYATRMNTTVAPGKPGEELVLKALGNGTQEEMLHALDFLRAKCEPGTMANIYSTYTTQGGEIKDLAYYVLWLMIIAGIKLPISVQYNIA